MAIVQNPITGRTKGKFSTAVFSKQFGKNTMRSKPVEVKNPRTLAQREQRAKFSLMVELSRKFLAFIRTGFKQAAVGMSEFNSFMQTNILNVITGIYPDYAIDYTKLIVSKGTLTGAEGSAATAGAGHIVTIDWTDNTGTGDAMGTDKALMLILNPNSPNVVANTTLKTRADGTFDLTVPVAWVGEEVHVYLSFMTEAGDKVADSSYVGAVTILA
ncbi:MAG TPA: DUF6266 family protein [Bacteroidales bacterium]|nr:DUF6266 family protein [Bacteroidales bacterium]